MLIIEVSLRKRGIGSHQIQTWFSWVHIRILISLGLTPLHCASQQNNTHIVLAILNAANNNIDLINRQDVENGNTALQFATMYGCLEIIALLLAAGADSVNKINKFGMKVAKKFSGVGDRCRCEAFVVFFDLFFRIKC